jgi:hypothetical protein
MNSKKLTPSSVAVASSWCGFVSSIVGGATKMKVMRRTDYVKSSVMCLVLALAAICMPHFEAFAQPVTAAGTYKHINIDGDFSDWAGVPLATTKAEVVGDVVSYENMYVANDEDYIYLRISLYSAADPFTFRQNFFFDVDNDATTGYSANGLGSEMLVQSGAGYRETNGIFNSSGITGVDWQSAPAAPASEYEARISRHAVYTNGAPVFTNSAVTFVLETDENSGNKWFPDAVGGLQYTFADVPTALSTNLTLVDAATSSWKVNDTGTDLGTDWLGQLYDDSAWTTGPGLFGYTPSAGLYPAIQTSLSPSANTYYFRTHFNFTNNVANAAFVVTNELSDGAIYYLNGAEVKRVRMPAGTVAYSDNATGTNAPEGTARVFAVSGGPLVSGDNILEVETHQAPGSSADMVFGLSLTAASRYPVTVQNTNLPANVSVVAGQPTTFTSDVFGSGPLSYQWYKNGTIIQDATNASYTIPLVLTNDAGSYSLAVTNSMSTNITRGAVLTVTGTPIVFTDTNQPADQYVVQGRPVALNVLASGSALVQYQWYQGSNPIQDATNASYSIAAVNFTNGGTYYAQVSNPVGPTNSRVATVTVLADTIAPSVTNISATARQVTITFSEPLDGNSATNPANYTLSGGGSFTNAVLNGQTVTLYTASPLTLGTVYTISINGVKDLFGNAAHTSASIAPTIIITIDGDMSDWAGIPPVYDNPTPGVDGAADFKDIYVYNDANYYYFRVTLWHDIPSANGFFPKYANMFYDTDNNSGTGYSAIGSEFLQQSSSFYQERGGGFNEGQVLVNMAAGYLIAPTVRETTFPADFEFRYPRNAQFSAASGGGLVFSTNVVNFMWQGQTPGFVVENTASINGGVISYTNTVATVVPAPPLGGLAISTVPGHNVAVTWDTPATLQSVDSLNNTWTNVSAAAAPYITPAANSQFFRLTK